MLTVRTSENTVITSFRLISERQDFSSVRTGENTVRARARIHSDVEDALKCSGKAEQIAELINDFEYELKNCQLADESLQKNLDEINSFFSEESERLMNLAEGKFR